MVTAAIRAETRYSTVRRRGLSLASSEVSIAALIWHPACILTLGGFAYGAISTQRNGDYGFAELQSSTIGGKVKRPISVHDAEPQTNEETRDTSERIRERAYELYELRRRSDGYELDDWLLAESQLLQKPQAKDS